MALVWARKLVARTTVAHAMRVAVVREVVGGSAALTGFAWICWPSAVPTLILVGAVGTYAAVLLVAYAPVWRRAGRAVEHGAGESDWAQRHVLAVVVIDARASLGRTRPADPLVTFGRTIDEVRTALERELVVSAPGEPLLERLVARRLSLRARVLIRPERSPGTLLIARLG